MAEETGCGEWGVCGKPLCHLHSNSLKIKLLLKLEKQTRIYLKHVLSALLNIPFVFISLGELTFLQHRIPSPTHYSFIEKARCRETNICAWGSGPFTRWPLPQRTVAPQTIEVIQMLREMQRFVRSVLTAVKTHHCQENKGCAMQASSCLCSICPLLPEWYPHVVLSVIMCAYVCFPSISLQVHPGRAEAWAPLSKPSLWFLLIAQCYHSEVPF